MSTIQQYYKRKERKIKKYHFTLLLADLLWENYLYCNYKYDHITGDDVFETSLRKENYSSKEKEKIIQNALLLLQIKYNIKLKDNWKEIYNKLDF